jgi:predicted metal-dependent hydrolase
MIAMNHSRRFWRAVERFEPDCRELDRRVGEAWGEIPVWAHERATRAESSFDLE